VLSAKAKTNHATRETLTCTFARTRQHPVQTGGCRGTLPRPLRYHHTIKAPLEQCVKPPWGPSAPWNPWAPVIPAGLTPLLLNPQAIPPFAVAIALCALAPLLSPPLIEMDETLQPCEGTCHLPAAALDDAQGLRRPLPAGAGGQHAHTR
jgi:hypothetical protein